MSKLEDYLVTQAGISTATGGRVRNSAIGNFPAIGEILLSPNEKFSDLGGITKFDQLICDGSDVDGGQYPTLVEGLSPILNLINPVLTDVSTKANGVCSSTSGDIIYARVADSTYNGTGYLYKSEDFGNTFFQVLAFTTGWNYGVCCSDDGQVVYCAAQQAVSKSVDGGSSFSTISTGEDTYGVACASDGSDLFYGNASNLDIYKRTGSTWTKVGDNVYGSGGTQGTGLLIGSNEELLLFPDGALIRELDTVTGVAEVIYTFTENVRSLSKHADNYYITTSEGVYTTEDYFQTASFTPISQSTISYVVNGHTTLGVDGGRNLYTGVGTIAYLPNMTPPDPSIPYRIIGDLT